MNKRLRSACGIILLLLTAAVQANPPALTDAQVRRFIASLPEIQQLADQEMALAEQDEEESQEGFDFANPMASAVQSMRGHAEHAKFSAVVKRHGFANLEQWATIGDRVFKAYMALQQEASGMQAQMAQALREIEQNPHLSAEQREQMKQMMGGSMQLMASVSAAPAADLEAVRPHLPQLRQLMEH